MGVFLPVLAPASRPSWDRRHPPGNHALDKHTQKKDWMAEDVQHLKILIRKDKTCEMDLNIKDCTKEKYKAWTISNLKGSKLDSSI